MADRPSQRQQQQSSNAQRPLPRKIDSSRSTSAIPSVENPSSIGQDVAPPHPSAGPQIFRVPQSARSSIGEAQNKSAKIAIPRLKRSIDVASEGSARSGGRHRVNHACEPCRHRKTKCSGERPICRHCQDFKIVCFYGDGKRDRVKKQFGSMAEKVAEYEKLLKELSTRVSEEDSNLIRSSLEKASQSEFDEATTEIGTIAAPSVEIDGESEISGEESEASGGAGSTGALDRTEEDFTREAAKPTGFMGKNSEVTWIQRLRQENRYGDSPGPDATDEQQQLHNLSTSSLQSHKQPGDDSVPLAEAADGFTIHESSYHLDDLSIGTDENTAPYEFPPPEIAQALFKTFMQRVHPSFPVVGQENLSTQFQRYLANPNQTVPDRWLAIINLIFAIAAKYAHLIQADWRGHERDHLIYFTRARMLAVNQETFLNHPDLQLIQIYGLMSFYLLTLSQVNRAWILTGIAIRSSVALGLNLRNDSTNLKDSLKEIRYRLWWSLYTLEHRLCSITGRANCILDDYYTTPLPVPYDETKFGTEEGQKLLNKESQQGGRAPSSHSQTPSSTVSQERSKSESKSNPSRSPSSGVPIAKTDLDWAKDVPMSPSLYFLHMVQLTRLTQNVFQRLYNPASIEKTWSYVQSQIGQLNDELDQWYRNLPPILDFRRKQRDREFYEFRLNLGFFYYGTKQMVHRPCLCRINRKLPNQSNKSREFNRAAATTCVEAALDLLRLIPDEPNAVGLIRVGPYWCILPCLVQSATVLMLEISFRAHHMPEEADSILESSKKVIRWLYALGEDNLSAKRAWKLCDSLLRDAVVRIGQNVNDLPEQAPGRQSTSSSGNGGTNMSGVSPAQTSHQSAHYPSTSMPLSMYGTMPSMPAYSDISGYDHMMQFDQYFPSMHGSGVSMGGLQQSQYAHIDSSEAEMEFMTNVYHDDQNAQQPPLPEDHSDNSGMPGMGSRYMS